MSIDPALVSLSYPKPRNLQEKIIPISRTDNNTLKTVLPKDAVVTGLFVYQNAVAVTANSTFILGWAGNTTGLINGFSMTTSGVGFAPVGTVAGNAFLAKLGRDLPILSTYSVGSSTAGGTGYVIIQYFLAGPGEGVDD